MIFEYKDLIGRPYQYAGRGPQNFDCYGLVVEIYRRCGIDIPDYRRPSDRAQIAGLIDGQKALWSECKPQRGAVVLIRRPKGAMHIGVCLDDIRFIHASEGVGSVAVEKLSVFKRRIVGYYRYE